MQIFWLELPEVVHSNGSSYVPWLGAKHVHFPSNVLIVLEYCSHLHLTLQYEMWEW